MREKLVIERKILNLETLLKKLHFKKKNLIFKAGDLLILHGNLVHGSYPNKSNKSRPLYSVSYITEGEKFISGLNAQRKIVN